MCPKKSRGLTNQNGEFHTNRSVLRPPRSPSRLFLSATGIASDPSVGPPRPQGLSMKLLLSSDASLFKDSPRIDCTVLTDVCLPRRRRIAATATAATLCAFIQDPASLKAALSDHLSHKADLGPLPDGIGSGTLDVPTPPPQKRGILSQGTTFITDTSATYHVCTAVTAILALVAQE